MIPRPARPVSRGMRPTAPERTPRLTPVTLPKGIPRLTPVTSAEGRPCRPSFTCAVRLQCHAIQGSTASTGLAARRPKGRASAGVAAQTLRFWSGCAVATGKPETPARYQFRTLETRALRHEIPRPPHVTRRTSAIEHRECSSRPADPRLTAPHIPVYCPLVAESRDRGVAPSPTSPESRDIAPSPTVAESRDRGTLANCTRVPRFPLPASRFTRVPGRGRGRRALARFTSFAWPERPSLARSNQAATGTPPHRRRLRDRFTLKISYPKSAPGSVTESYRPALLR